MKCLQPQISMSHAIVQCATSGGGQPELSACGTIGHQALQIACMNLVLIEKQGEAKLVETAGQ